jgi:hypothetical protein
MATGQVVSCVGSEIYWPVIDYDSATPENSFTLAYHWEKLPIASLMPAEWNSLRWTKKVSLETKNFHRQLWGMKPLKPKAPRATQRRTRRRRARRYTRFPRTAMGGLP